MVFLVGTTILIQRSNNPSSHLVVVCIDATLPIMLNANGTPECLVLVPSSISSSKKLFFQTSAFHIFLPTFLLSSSTINTKARRHQIFFRPTNPPTVPLHFTYQNYGSGHMKKSSVSTSGTSMASWRPTKFLGIWPTKQYSGPKQRLFHNKTISKQHMFIQDKLTHYHSFSRTIEAAFQFALWTLSAPVVLAPRSVARFAPPGHSVAESNPKTSHPRLVESELIMGFHHPVSFNQTFWCWFRKHFNISINKDPLKMRSSGGLPRVCELAARATAALGNLHRCD